MITVAADCVDNCVDSAFGADRTGVVAHAEVLWPLGIKPV